MHPLTDEAIGALLESIKAPQLARELIEQRVAEIYGLRGEWRPLGGEREQNFRLTTADGAKFVVKVASLDEPLASLVFQVEALEHIARLDPDLAIPRVRRTLADEPISSIEDGAGNSHALRVLSFVPGDTVLTQLRKSERLLGAEDLMTLGAAGGRLARNLQGFRSSGAPARMPWDLSGTLLFADRLHAHMPASVQPVLQTLLPRLAQVIAETMPRLRAQVIYNDFHESNILVRSEPDLSVVGTIDFGDMVFGPLVQDVAVCVASLIHWSPDPVFAAACLVRGYQRAMPLEAADLAVLKDLVLARLLLQVGIVSYQRNVHGREDADLDELQSLYVDAILRISAVADADFIAGMMPSVVPVPAIPAPPSAVPTPALLRRREGVLGKTYTFYDEPIELVRGRGCYVYDADGRQYLDCYNNVANLGHCHPYVVDALARQAATLNTNSRYLHTEIVRLGRGCPRPCRPISIPGFSSAPGRRPMTLPCAWRAISRAGTGWSSPRTATMATHPWSRRCH